MNNKVKKSALKYLIENLYYLRIHNSINKEESNEIEALYKVLNKSYEKMQKDSDLNKEQLLFLLEYLEDKNFSRKEAIDLINYAEEHLVNSNILYTNEKSPTYLLPKKDLEDIKYYSIYSILNDKHPNNLQNLDKTISRIGENIGNDKNNSAVLETFLDKPKDYKKNVLIGKFIVEEANKHHDQYIKDKNISREDKKSQRK